MDKDLTRYDLIGMGVVVMLVFGTLFYTMYRDISRSHAETEARREACSQLDVKLYDAVKVKGDKFYADQVFYARSKRGETVVVAFPFADNPDNFLTFYCSDIEKTEDPYKGVFQ